MKTPKASTPTVKSKLNTPRSGFIKKGSESAKKMKFNVLNSEVSKSNNSTPKLDKSAISEYTLGNFGSGKKGKSPFNDSGIQFGGKKSPQKKKTLAEPEAVKNNSIMKAETPKTGKQNSPTGKLKQNKASPEVQLGLDIEQYLNKNSKPKMKSGTEQSTPTGKKQPSNSKLSPSPQQKISPNQPVGNQAKKRKGSPIPKHNFKQSKKSENTVGLIDKVTLTDAVKALIKYIDENPKEKNEMLGPNVPLLLQIEYIKQPHTKRSRILVPHSLVYENSDICLFIADKGKKREEQDDLVDEMKERLKKCGIDYITEILPWKKALHEHTQYEQKRKLMNRFDFFLIEDKLSKIKAGLTEKFVPRKWPIAVRLDPESKLKENIETALRKIPVSFKGQGLTKVLQFGHYKMAPQQLVENLESITKELCDPTLFAGGRDNIRSLHLKTHKSIDFPLFVNTKSSNLVKNLPKEEQEEDEGVEGELTTLPNRIVKVFKDGTVKTKKIKNDKADTSKKQNKKNKKEVTTKKEESDDDEEEMMESDIDEEDGDDEEISEDEDVDDEEVATDEDDDDEEEEEDNEDDDDDSEEEDEDEEDIHSEEEAEIRAKLNSLIKKQKPKKNKKKKSNSETDEEDIDEAERGFLEELRRQQDEIESQAKKALKSPGMKKLLEPLNKKRKPNKPESSNNQPSKKVASGKGQFHSIKNQQKSNMNANDLKKNDANKGLSKSAKKRRNKNKQNKNANNSPTFKNKNQNKPTPGGKKFVAKG